MNITEQYIKMCESAKEIQESWKPDVGDWFLNDFRGTSGFSKDLEKQIQGDDKKEWEKIQCLTYKPSIEGYVSVSDSDGSHTYKADEFFKHRHIWLPRQDQLQKMLLESEKTEHITIDNKKVELPWRKSAMSLLCRFRDFVVRPMFDDKMLHRKELAKFMHESSMEQLLLAFVMDKIYNKRWNGKDKWIKNDTIMDII